MAAAIGQVTRLVYDGDGSRVLRRVEGGETTVYIGDYYEREGSTVRKYYYAGGQRIAVRVDGALYFLHSDHLGSATLATDAGGNRVGEARYKPYGEARYIWGVMPTDRLYTGQRWEGLGLYNYGARMYSPGLGRWISPDALVPSPANPQSLNRYAYVYNSPVTYLDADGRFPIVPVLIAAGVVVLKVVDYGWTVYDVYQSGRVLANPNAGRGEKLLAGLNIALAVAFEGGEPDDEIPVSVPLDDIGRLGVIAGARRALAEGGEEALGRYLRERLGPQADEVLEWVMREVREEAAEARGGTYMLVDRVTGEVKYVGQTNNLARRAVEHQRDPIKSRLIFVEDWRVDDLAIRRGRE